MLEQGLRDAEAQRKLQKSKVTVKKYVRYALFHLPIMAAPDQGCSTKTFNSRMVSHTPWTRSLVFSSVLLVCGTSAAHAMPTNKFVQLSCRLGAKQQCCRFFFFFTIASAIIVFWCTNTSLTLHWHCYFTNVELLDKLSRPSIVVGFLVLNQQVMYCFKCSCLDSSSGKFSLCSQLLVAVFKMKWPCFAGARPPLKMKLTHMEHCQYKMAAGQKLAT